MTAPKKTTAQRYAERILDPRPAPDSGRPSWERHAERLRQTVQPTENPATNQQQEDQ